MRIYNWKIKRKRNRTAILLIFSVIFVITINFPKDLDNTPVKILPIRFDNLTTSSVYPEIWNRTWGYSSQDWGTCVALDNENNIIVGGSSPNSGERHIFLVKYNSTPLQLWNKTWSKASHDEIYDIVLDNENNIYATGRTGPYGTTGKRMLLIKFNATGDEVWHVEWTGSNDQGARAIALDSSENIYVCGRATNNDSFIRRYNSDGLLNWSKEWGGGGSGYEDWPGIYGMTIDKEDNIYITGRTINLGPGGMDVFLLKYNYSGDLQWAQTWGYLGDERGYDVDMNSHNDLFVTCFSSTANTLYLVKYNSSGSQIWNRTISTFSIQGAFEIDINSRDMMFVSGTKPDNNEDIFLLVLDYDGGIYKYYNWSLSGTEKGLDMALDENNEIYLTGLTNSIGAGNWDMLLVKYSSINRHIVDPIHINGTATGIGANNWTWARSQFWCRGSGTYLDPYVIENLEIDGNGIGNCMEVQNSDKHFIINHCTVYNSSIIMMPQNGAGIELNNVSNGILIGNNCSMNSNRGIYCYESENIQILDNIANDNNLGIVLNKSGDCIISGNTANDATGYGISLIESANNLVYDNNAHYNNFFGIVCVKSSRNNTIYHNNASLNEGYGIVIDLDANNNTVSENNANFNYQMGIAVGRSNESVIKGNIVENNMYGITLTNASQNIVSKNYIFNNSLYGIWLTEAYGPCDNNIFFGNDVINNTEAGIYIDKPLHANNFFNKNEFLTNGLHIFDNGTDTHWDDGNVGNYWDNYTGVDSDDDGIGDTPHVIQQNPFRQDNFPIWDDGDDLPPTIEIQFPTPDQLIGSIAPTYNVEIHDLNLDTMWYTLDNGAINITFTANGTLDQSTWDTLPDGAHVLIFYANDTLSHINSAQVIINKDSKCPNINIIFPTSDQLFGENSPSFNVEVYDLNLDTMWYTIDGGVTNITFTTNGTIDQNNWTAHIDGPITIIFYANDTVGHINSAQVTINKDTSIPNIRIFTPSPDQLFSESAPNFIVEIRGNNLDTFWYSLDNGENNFTFSANETINQAAWDSLPNGTIIIRFYANDTINRITFTEVHVKKDIEDPIILIVAPTMNDEFEIPPAYELTITEANLDKIWYTFDDGANNIFITETIGVMNLTLWNQLSNGYITIRFYANDTLGNIGFDEVIVIKDTPTPSPPPVRVPGYNVIILLGMISLIAAFIIRRQSKIV